MLAVIEGSSGKVWLGNRRGGVDRIVAGKIEYHELTSAEGAGQAILDVHSGGAPMSAEIARRVVEAFQDNTPKSADESEPVRLSQREAAVKYLDSVRSRNFHR